MKSYNTIYYVLTVLLIMGAFASMAQNPYGMFIISGVCIAFALLFLVQFIQVIQLKESRNPKAAVEFFILFLLAAIFTLRTFQIYVPFIEWIFALAGLILALIYLQRLLIYNRLTQPNHSKLSILVLIGYGSVILFCLAMVMLTVRPAAVRWAGGLAFLLAIVFLIAGLLNGRMELEGERRSGFMLIAGFKDRFYLLLTLFIIFSLYTGLSASGLLPKLYSDKFPQAYYRLVNQAEAGKEKPVGGELPYERFKRMYSQFVERNIDR